MVQRVAGPQIKAPGRREIIPARFLQELSGGISRNARAIAKDNPQYPLGQDGDTTEGSLVLTETPGTAVFGATQTIAQVSDPNIFVQVRNKIQVTMTDPDGNAYQLNFEDTLQP